MANRLFRVFHNCLALFVLAWMSSGVISYVLPMIPNYVRYFLFAIWFLLAVSSEEHFLVHYLKGAWPLLVFVGYVQILSISTTDSYLRLCGAAFTYLAIIYALFIYYFEPKQRAFRLVMVGFLALETLFVAINTYVSLTLDPMISRYLAQGIDAAREQSSLGRFEGIGGYGFFYGLVSIILFLLYVSLNGGSHKLVWLIAVFGLTAVLIKASFTISIIFTLGFAIVLLLRRVTKGAGFAFLVIYVALLAVSAKDFVALGLGNLSRTGGMSDAVGTRLQELSGFLLQGVQQGTDLEFRLAFYASSVDAFLQNWVGGLVQSPTLGSTVGGHSAWLDLLGYFGLSSLLLVYFLIKVYKYTGARIPDSFKGYYRVYWLYFSLLGFVNTLSLSGMFTVWFLFLPMAIVTVDEYQDRSQVGGAGFQTPSPRSRVRLDGSSWGLLRAGRRSRQNASTNDPSRRP